MQFKDKVTNAILNQNTAVVNIVEAVGEEFALHNFDRAARSRVFDQVIHYVAQAYTRDPGSSLFPNVDHVTLDPKLERLEANQPFGIWPKSRAEVFDVPGESEDSCLTDEEE